MSKPNPRMPARLEIWSDIVRTAGSHALSHSVAYVIGLQIILIGTVTVY
jgi:hypothetical protein